MRAGLGFSNAFGTKAAARDAVSGAREALSGACENFALVFATAAWGPELGKLLERIDSELCGVDFVGASVAGAFAGTQAAADNPAVVVALLADWQPECLLIEDLACDDPQAGAELLDHLAAPLGSDDLLLLALDVRLRSPAALLSGLARGLDAGLVAGLGASALPGGDAFVWRGTQRVASGVLACVLRPAAATHWGIAPGCRSISARLEVTRARDRWISTLSGEPAIDVLRAAAANAHLEASADSLRQLLVRVDREDGLSYPISGVDPRRGAILLPADISIGQPVRITMRDAVAARESLEAVVDQHARGKTGLGLYLASSRGGHASQGDLARDARCFVQRAPSLPVLGLRAAHVIGPPGATGRGAQLLAGAALLAVVEG